MSALGIGLIGAGHFGAVHAQAIAQVPGLRLAAVCAREPETTVTFAARHGGTPYADWRRVLDDRAVAAVVIATPHDLHAEIAIAAAEAGRHVLVEKPMAPRAADCRAMIAAARRAGVVLMVGQVMRTVLPCLRAKEILAAGGLGRPRFATSRFIKRWMEANRQDWHLRQESGGGMLLTAGIHALDRLVWLLDQPVAAVSAMSGTLFHDQAVPDSDLLLLRFADGMLGQVASVGAREATVLNDAEIHCESGVLRIDMERGVSIGRDDAWQAVPDSAEPEWLPRGIGREWRAFLAAIRDGAAVPADGAAGLHLIACLEAAARAAAERREVAVELR